MSRLPLLVALLLSSLVLAACGGSEDKKAEATSTPPPSPAEAVGCEQVEQPAPKDAKLPKPDQKLAPGKTYVATVTTSCGAFEITLDAKRAPRTGGSFKYLADKRFYDGLTFHRIIAGFIVQGGAPAPGTERDAGYAVVEPPPASVQYSKGVVAMARKETERPGLSRCQFFIVTAEDAQLPPDYALLGKVTKGQEVVDKIGVVPTVANDEPAEPVVIRSIKVTAS